MTCQALNKRALFLCLICLRNLLALLRACARTVKLELHIDWQPQQLPCAPIPLRLQAGSPDSALTMPESEHSYWSPCTDQLLPC